MCEDRYNPWKLSPNVLERFFIGIPGRCNMCTQKPARRESKAVCTHTNSAIASYPREFSFKKGRRESVSSLFSSLIIGSRRTYSSKEKSVLHTKVMPFTCFLSPREKNHRLCSIRESRCCAQEYGLTAPDKALCMERRHYRHSRETAAVWWHFTDVS